MKTIDSINEELQELYKERNRLMAITADGVHIAIGMKLYTWSGFDIEAFVVPEDVRFEETSLHSKSVWIDEDYRDLFADPILAVQDALNRAKSEVERSEARLLGAKKQLEKVELVVKMYE